MADFNVAHDSKLYKEISKIIFTMFFKKSNMIERNNFLQIVTILKNEKYFKKIENYGKKNSLFLNQDLKNFSSLRNFITKFLSSFREKISNLEDLKNYFCNYLYTIDKSDPLEMKE